MDHLRILILVAFLVTVISSLLIIPVIRKYSIRKGFVSKPRKDRWHKAPIPTLGGVGIVISFLLGVIVLVFYYFYTIAKNPGGYEPLVGILLSGIFIFFMGLIDDAYQLKPIYKLIGQFGSAIIVISFGIRTDFFTPRVANTQLAFALNNIITVLWIVVITNTINLLDNMDGLAAGISFIAAVILGYLFWTSENMVLLSITLVLAGSIIGFLVYNFPPASIFMGDCGSQFLGLNLAVLAIARQPQASNVFAVLGVPALLFILPIVDTGLVAYTRIMSGRSPMQGGRDHTSHRLIEFGLSERQVVIFLYGVAIVAGIAAISIEAIGYWVSLILIPILVIGLALFAAYLGGLKIVAESHVYKNHTSMFTRLVNTLTYRRRFLEILLDLLLICICFYLSFLFITGINEFPNSLPVFLSILPIVLGISIVALASFGVYRSVWKYISVNDAIRYIAAVIVGFILIFIVINIFFEVNSSLNKIILLYAIFLLFSVFATRISFRIFNSISLKLHHRPSISREIVEDGHADDIRDSYSHELKEPVLVFGANPHGELALRWIELNPNLGLLPVGYIDEDENLIGKNIRGIKILGGSRELDTIVRENQVKGIIIAENPGSIDDFRNIEDFCNENGCWIRLMDFKFQIIKNID